MLICRIGQNSEDSFDRQCIICRISRISEDFCSAMFELPHHLSVGCPKINLFSTVPDLPPISKSSLPLISRIYEDWIVRQRSICRRLKVVVEIPKIILFESGRFAELIAFPKFFDNARMRGLSNDWLSSTVLDLSQLLDFRRQMKLVWCDYAQLGELVRSKDILVRRCSICRFLVLFSRIVSVSLVLFNSTRTDELRQISEDVRRSVRFSRRSPKINDTEPVHVFALSPLMRLDTIQRIRTLILRLQSGRSIF